LKFSDKIVKGPEDAVDQKEPKVYRGPSKRGPCAECGADGIKRYMIAVDLPEPMHLCDGHYKQIREELRSVLRAMLRKRGLLHGK
jgi:hypothetical protein